MRRTDKRPRPRRRSKSRSPKFQSHRVMISAHCVASFFALLSLNCCATSSSLPHFATLGQREMFLSVLFSLERRRQAGARNRRARVRAKARASASAGRFAPVPALAAANFHGLNVSRLGLLLFLLLVPCESTPTSGAPVVRQEAEAEAAPAERTRRAERREAPFHRLRPKRRRRKLPAICCGCCPRLSLPGSFLDASETIGRQARLCLTAPDPPESPDANNLCSARCCWLWSRFWATQRRSAGHQWPVDAAGVSPRASVGRSPSRQAQICHHSAAQKQTNGCLRRH